MQLQGYTQISKGMTQMAEAIQKKAKMMVDAKLKRDEIFLRFKAEEAGKNRAHEPMIAKIVAASSAPQPSVVSTEPFGYQHQHQKRP